MLKCNIVVGLLFGDEGKGLITDRLCKKALSEGSKPLVIRFSGGQQAGHTVVVDGIRHVHSSFGSGTLRGVPSFFSEHTTFYPPSIWKEKIILGDKSILPKLYIHPLANLTTHYDVAWNRAIEEINGHGSCGLGVGATMKRNLETPYKIFAVDLNNKSVLREKLVSIKKFYERKIEEIGNEELAAIFCDEYSSQELPWEYSIKTLEKTTENLFEVSTLEALIQRENYQTLIFEGSQGILLDMDHGIFPNVTYANTTCKNAMQICKTLGIESDSIEMFEITRCYLTRHGNGWISGKEEDLGLVNNEDETNVHNDYQGDFRIAEIDYGLINYAMDINSSYSPLIKRNLVVTCLDQRPDFKFNPDAIKSSGLDKIFLSSSPSSDSVLEEIEGIKAFREMCK